MRKTDISRYTGAPVPNGRHPSSGTTAKKTAGIVFSTIFKIIGSFLLIMFFTGIIVGSSVLINIFKMADNTVDVLSLIHIYIIIERDETIETVGELVDIIDELSCQEG